MKLTSDKLYYDGGIISFDDSKIAFYADFGDSSAIGIIDCDGRNLRMIRYPGQNYCPTWSPDADWLVLNQAVPRTEIINIDIAAIELEAGSTPIPIVTKPYRESEPNWRSLVK